MSPDQIRSPTHRRAATLVCMASVPPECIETDRLVLRRESVHDAAVVADAIARNRARLLPWMRWVTDQATEVTTQVARIAEAGEQWASGQTFDFGIFDPSDGSFMGKIGMHRRIGPRGIELGYWLDADAEGRGVMTEATAALTKVALELDDIDRVEIHCDEANLRSQAVPKRLGFVLDRVENRPIAAASETGRHMVWVYQPDCR